MISTCNESPRIRDIIINKIETSKPNARILTEIKNKITSLQNKTLDATLSVLKHIEDNNSISKNIGSICNLKLVDVDKNILSAMIDIHHREKKKNHLAIICYSNVLKEINVKATDKEIKLTNKFIKLSSKIEEGHTIIKNTIKILDTYFKSCEGRLNETPKLEKKIDEYEDQNKILLNLIKHNKLQESKKMDIEEKINNSNKYNGKLNEAINELISITSSYTSILENRSQFKNDIDNNEILEVMKKHIKTIEKINTNYLNV